jgi:hypothetical protein
MGGKMGYDDAFFNKVNEFITAPLYVSDEEKQAFHLS